MPKKNTLEKTRSCSVRLNDFYAWSKTRAVINFFLLLQIFHFRVDQENRLSNMFPQEVLPQMFANIKSIYKFHAEFLLPQVWRFLES